MVEFINPSREAWQRASAVLEADVKHYENVEQWEAAQPS
jgi:hypothetical protein